MSKTNIESGNLNVVFNLKNTTGPKMASTADRMVNLLSNVGSIKYSEKKTGHTKSPVKSML